MIFIDLLFFVDLGGILKGGLDVLWGLCFMVGIVVFLY